MKKEDLINVAFQALLDNTEDMIFIKDKNLVYMAASTAFARMVGKNSPQEIVGHTDQEIFEDQNLAWRYVADDYKLLQGNQNLIEYIEPITDEDGQARFGSTSKYILKNEQGEQIGILGVTKDITCDYLARQHFQLELKYLFKLPENTFAVSYIDIDDWRIITQRRQNLRGGTLQSCLTVEQLCEAACESMVDAECAAARFYRKFSKEAIKLIYAGGRTSLSFEYRRLLSNDQVCWVQNEIRLLRNMDSGHLCAMLTVKDIDGEKREEQELMKAARLDRMTMILNRETTMNEIRGIFSNESEKIHALFMIDIDNFKNLNDTLGHQCGDEFLIRLAQKLKASFRDTDVVGRIGGDEFFMLMRNIPDRTAAVGKAEKLLKSIQELCAVYPDVSVSGSIGISVYPENGTTLDAIYGAADAALYGAKRAGKNQFCLAEKIQ